ncbi:hypothetical protein SAMN03159338_1519 [Sphingomonas sp. NFR04]|uniref:hypothetical protein n=1 Tax=Sphingomonas sp. NFR04 TaxID=1566283 RepID=UPI0008E197E2|nr:hypothetical protein [Sphingomonas sp. NFR04]SFJ48307.1 hypothetical protein SAMN03159338_1519 [Sphingomonas sp. NFR04]
MIDFSLPIRTVRTRRRLYVTGGQRLDTRPDAIGTGFVYGALGSPVDEGCPWGKIETFDPTEDLFVEEEEVETPWARRAREETERANASSPLWGMF